MLEKQFSKIADVQERYPWLMLALLLVMTMFMLFFAIRLQTDSSFDILYNDGSPSLELKNMVATEFGTNDGIYVLVSVDDSSNDGTRVQDIRDPTVFSSMAAMAQSLREEPAVASVFSVTDLFYQFYGHLPQSLEESKAMLEQLPLDTSNLVSSDFSAANIIIELDLPGKSGVIRELEDALQQRLDDASKPTGVDVIMTGEPLLRNHVMELLLRDNMFTVFIALVAIYLVLVLFFRSWLTAFITIQPVIVMIIFLAATMQMLGIALSVITAAIGTMMVGMGIDYSIHMTHGFYEELRKKNPHSTKTAMTRVGGALVASVLTTLAGFIAMTTGSSPMSRIQGTVLALGIIFALFASVLMLPNILILYRKLAGHRLERHVQKMYARREKKGSIVKKGLEKLAQLQAKIPWSIIVIFLVITALLLPGLIKVRMDTDNENWFTDNDPFILAIEEVSSKFSGLDSQTFLIMVNESATDDGAAIDLRDRNILLRIAAYDEALEHLSYISSVDSPSDVIKEAFDGYIPRDQDQIDRFIAENAMAKGYFSGDFRVVKIAAVTDGLYESGPGTSDADKYDEMINEAQSVGFPDSVIVVGQGGIAEGLELDRTLSGDIIKTTIIGFVLVFIIALLIYRSFTAGSMAILPVIFAAVWTVSIMGYVDLPFTVLTSGMLAIVMGIGIDYSIHLIHNTRLWLKDGHSITDSIAHALTTTGEAIFASTLTTMIGFCALIFASLLATQRLGFTLAIAIGACFVICIVLVPATLVIEHSMLEKRRKRT